MHRSQYAQIVLNGHCWGAPFQVGLAQTFEAQVCSSDDFCTSLEDSYALRTIEPQARDMSVLQVGLAKAGLAMAGLAKAGLASGWPITV